MPTPEAMEEADYIRRCCPSRERFEAEVFNAFVATRLDRFAAQRMKEAGLLRIVKKERVPFVVDPEDGAPPQTGGGDAPDMSMEAVKARLATYEPLGSHAKGVAGPAIAPDELPERDGADPTQTGGGDAPRRHLTQDEVRIMDKALLRSSTLIHAGELAGGDAGERDERLAEIRNNLINDPHILGASSVVFLLGLVDAGTAALRSSHREGAEARRIGIEAIDFAHQWIAGLPVTPSFEDKRAAQASLEEAREQLLALPIPGKTNAKRGDG